MGTFLLVLILSVLSFNLFFFNVPYWTGKEMGDVAHNGFYRLAYVLVSTVGWEIYKIIETFNNFIVGKLKIPKGGTIHAVINTVIYAAIVLTATTGYDAVMSIAIGGEVDEIDLANLDSYSKYSDLLLLWRILNNFVSIKSPGDFFEAVQKSAGGIVFFIVGTIVFFSIMYGLLMHKLKEIHLVQRFAGDTYIGRLLEEQENFTSIKYLPRNIASSFAGFCDELSILRNFKIRGVQFAFLAVLAVYSTVVTLVGDAPSLNAFLLDLLDETGIVTTIGSFIISYIFAKITSIVGRFLYTFVPAPIGERITDVSVACKVKSEKIKEKRRQWSEKMDAIYASTLSEFEGRVRKIQRITLE